MWRIMIKVENSDHWSAKKTYEWKPMRTSCGVIYNYADENSATKIMMSYYGKAYYEGKAKVEFFE